MKVVSTAAAAFLAFCAVALGQFEGIATFKGLTESDGRQIPSDGKVFASKSAVRVEWEMNLAAGAEAKASRAGMPANFRMVMIQKLAEPDRMYVVNDNQKTYAIEMIDDKKERPTSERPWKVQKLGRDKVAGLTCEKALLTALDGDETEVCVSTEIIPSAAWLRAWNRREEQSSPLKALNDAGIKGFPIRWIFRSGKDKKVSSSVELVAFDRKSVPGSLFEIPAGYKKVGSMMETMMTSDQSKQYQDAMDQLTPEQRKAVEEMLKQQQQQAKPEKR